MIEINDIQAGKVGEYLVCADLILKGYVAFPTEQGLHYDVVLSVGNKLYKVQVKATRSPQFIPQRKNDTKKYLFHVRRCGKGGRKQYAKDDVDIFALVALDTKEIGYIKADKVKQTMFFLPVGMLPVNDTTDRKEKIIALRKEGLSYNAIGKELLVDPAYANRVVLGKQNKSYSRSYLTDFNILEAI
jgi:hypothetical protein